MAICFDTIVRKINSEKRLTQVSTRQQKEKMNRIVKNLITLDFNNDFHNDINNMILIKVILSIIYFLTALFLINI